MIKSYVLVQRLFASAARTAARSKRSERGPRRIDGTLPSLASLRRVTTWRRRIFAASFGFARESDGGVALVWCSAFIRCRKRSNQDSQPWWEHSATPREHSTSPSKHSTNHAEHSGRQSVHSSPEREHTLGKYVNTRSRYFSAYFTFFSGSGVPFCPPDLGFFALPPVRLFALIIPRRQSPNF